MLLNIAELSTQDTIIYNSITNRITYDFNASGVAKSEVIDNPSEKQKEMIYGYFGGFHDCFLKKITFDSVNRELCIEVISEDKYQILCVIRCIGVSNMILPVESPWNTRTLFINDAFIEGEWLEIELLTGDLWRIKGDTYIFQSTGKVEFGLPRNARYYPEDKIPGATEE